MVLEHRCVHELGVGQFLGLGRVVRVHSEDAVLARLLDQALLVAGRRLHSAHRVPLQLELLLLLVEISLRITVLRVEIHTVLVFWYALERWRHQRSVSLGDSRQGLLLFFRYNERLLGLIIVDVGVLLSHGQVGDARRLH